MPQLKPAQIKAFHRALHQWYGAHGRHDLPWRNTRDPYAIWVSEVMLQQTQVKTVLERYYEPFLKRFPTVEALATASQTEVMKAWEGLGYYSRAANLQKAAQQILSSRLDAGISRHLPEFVEGDPGFRRDDMPNGLTSLLALPGIGRNTAHAILAFAFHQPYPVLEANVKRVIARVWAHETPGDTELWEAATQLLDRAEPFDYNQAMMDLGAMICTPKNPACIRCPANGVCTGKADPERYPAKKAKKIAPTREVKLVIAEDARRRLYLEQRQDRLLGGLYGFPQVSIHEPSFPRRRESMVGLGAEGSWIPACTEMMKENSLGTATHTYSHFKLIAEVVLTNQGQTTNRGGYFSRTEIEALPLSKIDHKALALYDNVRLANVRRKKA